MRVGVVWTFASLVYHFSFLSPSLWVTVRYRLKYCLKGPLSTKTTNQPTLIYHFFLHIWQTTFHRLKYCPKEPLNPKRPTNQNPTDDDLHEINPKVKEKSRPRSCIPTTSEPMRTVCSTTLNKPGPEVIKLISCSTQLSTNFFLLINVKMPTTVGILTCMSRKNSILGLSEPAKS